MSLFIYLNPFCWIKNLKEAFYDMSVYIFGIHLTSNILKLFRYVKL